MKNTLLTIVISLLVQSHVVSQETRVDSEIYKWKDKVSLTLKVYYPPSVDNAKKYPGMVFFQGGPWDYGRVDYFMPQAEYFAKRGMVCFLAEYGEKDGEKNRFRECIADAKDAVRFIRKNAERLNVDGKMIIAAGGSAGGHLAASTAVIRCCEEPSDQELTDCVPNALVLFNPAIDFGPGDQYLFKLEGETYMEISPLHNIRSGVPPSILLHGTEDRFMPIETVKYFKHVVKAVGGRCDLFLYEGQGHGFFNFHRSEKYYKETVLEVDRFLISLGYIDGAPTIMEGN